jgi:hypothetical protein
MDSKIKHLEFIQNVITRMNSNSFFIKGWNITLIAALFALSVQDKNTSFIFISFISILFFWILDGFYISQERKFRALYSEVCDISDSDINFSMDTSKFKYVHTWIKGFFSKTLLIVYPTLIILNILLIIFLYNF